MEYITTFILEHYKVIITIYIMVTASLINDKLRDIRDLLSMQFMPVSDPSATQVSLRNSKGTS